MLKKGKIHNFLIESTCLAVVMSQTRATEMNKSCETTATKFSWNQNRLHHDLSEDVLCFLIRFRLWGAIRGGELICVYGVTMAPLLHVKKREKKACLGKGKDVRSLLHCFGGLWRNADKTTTASAFDSRRCIYL